MLERQGETRRTVCGAGRAMELLQTFLAVCRMLITLLISACDRMMVASTLCAWSNTLIAANGSRAPTSCCDAHEPQGQHNSSGLGRACQQGQGAAPG